MKQKGFVFIETIIVITILSVSLLVVYRAFNTSLNHEKIRQNYDAPTYIYRTFYIKSFLNTELIAYEDLLLDENKIITPVTCNNITDVNTKNFCRELIQNEKFGAVNVYLAKGKISKLFTEHKGEQSNLSSGVINYIKTLPDEDGYIFIIEFIENCEKIEGTSADSCEYNYASIKVKEPPKILPEPEPLPRLYDLILAQGGGKSAIEAKGKPNLSVVPTALTSGLYATQDEYGTSYYYRGEKDSLANNVIFAGFQWKVVRINGDSSIRLIYNGVCPNNSCTINSTGSATAINNGLNYIWNTTSIYHTDAKYVGYMYGGLNGVPSTSQTQSQMNQTSSIAKTALDIWYESYIKNTKYEEYVVDNIFCNDRSIDWEAVPYDRPEWGHEVDGILFEPFIRLGETVKPTPTLKCEQKNDRFTVSDTTKGNGALIYPIGLITADEAQYAGIGYSAYNTRQYLHTGHSYWTLSPNFFVSWGGESIDIDDRNAVMFGVDSTGALINDPVYSTRSLRALLNLTTDALVSSGDGTASNPYIIFTK